MSPSNLDRRTLLKLAGAVAGASLLPSFPAVLTAQPAAVLTRKIPSSGEAIPVMGMGSWGTFNVGDDQSARDNCTRVLKAFLDAGGRLVDSSPMYGSSHNVIGYGLGKLGRPTVFAADKVWTNAGKDGPLQIEETRKAWGVPRFDLLQVHNLTAWEEHLPMLFAMKKEGRLRYVGITTSHGRRHDDIEKIMRAHPIDFVQLTYNLQDREAEARLLPLAQEKGIAVIANRPFQRNDLIRRFDGKPLPPWAGDMDAKNWPQFLLKFIVSHPAITSVIPATSNPAHAQENVAVTAGRIPDEGMRRRMIQYSESL
jgi:diketogulonate reductase-like aldo/keto reductase